MSGADGDNAAGSRATATPATTLVAVGYLRAFVVVLVLAHHSVLAHHPFAPAPGSSLTAEPRAWLAFPIVDGERSVVWGLLATWNDLFFMSLMFFLSGLFVWQSLARKGARAFLRGRILRLGLPFVVAAALLGPLAYYPSYLVTTTTPTLAEFRDVWLSLGTWPDGPVWFVWVLLVFDALVAALFALAPGSGALLARAASRAREHPTAFCARLLLVSALAYVPLAAVFGAGRWSTFGPFTMQTSRVLLYLVYFLAGAGVGIYGIDRGLLASVGMLARRWSVWLPLALAAFVLALGAAVATSAPERSSFAWRAVAGLAFTLSCAASSFLLLAIFVRFVRAPRPLLDSLRDNAYAMYLVHFVFVVWLQYALLPVRLSAIVKASLVFLVTLALSWASAAALRRVPAIARVV